MNFKLRTLAFAATAFLTSVLPAFAVPADEPYITTASAMFARWGYSIGREVKWEAGYDWNMRVFEHSQPSTVEEFELLAQEFNKLFNRHRPDASAYFYCIHPNVVVVRQAGQAECGKPLDKPQPQHANPA